MNKIQQTIKTKKFKKIISIAFIATMVGWVLFRFAAVASENARYVFNASRNAIEHGMPIETLVLTNNRAYVSAERAKKLKPGQKVGNGKIVFVSKNIDLDTGMFLVKTQGVENGLQFAEFTADGFFIPLYAIKNNTVFVVENNTAVARNIEITHQDSETAYITSGVKDGDIVILSNVNAGNKVKIN